MKYLLPLGIFLILAGFLYIGLNLDPRDIGSTRIDKPAPTFSLPQVIDSKKTLSNQDFIGKVSLLNVWASWCNTCRYEHPLLMQLAQYKINIYGLDYKDTLEEARKLLNRDGNPYISSGFDEKGAVGIEWGVTGTPETFVIDKKGIVRYKHTGQLTSKIMKQKILPMIQTLEKAE